MNKGGNSEMIHLAGEAEYLRCDVMLWYLRSRGDAPCVND